MASLDMFDGIKKEFPDVLRRSYGIISEACKKVGINRQTFYNWRNSDPEFAEACKEAEEYTGDFVESKLLQLIESQNPTAIIFYCKTKLRKRGYIERIEHTGEDGNKIKTETSISSTDIEILDRYYSYRLQSETNKLRSENERQVQSACEDNQHNGGEPSSQEDKTGCL